MSHDPKKQAAPIWPEMRADYRAWAEHALALAQRKGATAAEVGVSCGEGLSVQVRMGAVDTVTFNRDREFGISVYVGHARGHASTSDLTWDAISTTVEAACDIAKRVTPDGVSAFPDRDDLAFDAVDMDLDLYHPWGISAPEAIVLAQNCEQAARAYDARLCNSDGASVETHQGWHIHANTHGFIGETVRTYHALGCYLVAKQGEEMQREGWYTASRVPSGLESADEVARQSAERTLARLGARQIRTQKAPVIFAAPCAKRLLGMFLSAIKGGALYRKSSFLLDHLGKVIFPEWVQIQENPHIPQGIGSAAYDSEGVRTRAQYFVESGVLRAYVLNTYTARRLGMQTTGNAGGVRNLAITPNWDGDLPSLLREMGTGLLVTELFGNGTNILTGDYSQGASGFWVENGEIQYPVEEITIAGRLQDIFQGLRAVGSDWDRRGGIWTGSWWLPDLMVAGK